MLSKKEKLFAAVEALGGLVCPTCGRPVSRRGDSLVCPNSHCLNVNRRGTLNVLSEARQEDYRSDLFEARSRVFAAGFFDPVAEAIETLLTEKDHRLLDAGCGEGWYLNRLLTVHPDWTGAGVDISRDAIRLASDQPCTALWCVADLRRLPFADGTFTAVLDILTPAGYDEFSRVLTPDGLLIKVYPGSEYLKEIRVTRGLPLYAEGEVETYLRAKARVVSECHIHQETAITPELWCDLIRMTPMNRDLTEEKLHALDKVPAPAVTVDLHVAAAVPE
ncbi:MAG: methyltransferase domain-containing protein [Clostridia bacterium]|nr:methyltransferase domain-containing protein [Clostridia bacterium]